MRAIFILVLLLLASVVIGCRTIGSSIQLGLGSDRSPKTVDQVELLIDEPERPYTKIGLVKAGGGNWGSLFTSEKKSFERLKEEAGKIGADAVIVTGSGRRVAAYMPATVNTYSNATAYGNTAYGTSTSTVNPGGAITVPEVTGLAIAYK